MADKNSKYPGPSKNAPPSGGFGKFLWNSDTGEFLGRTGTSWFKITVFYIIFFSGLAAFFGLMLWVFYQTLDPQQPKWIGAASLIGTNPGVGFRPMPDQDSNVESTLIWYRRSDQKDREFWSKQLAIFVDAYETTSASGSEVVDCSVGNKHADVGVACKVDITQFGPCNKLNDFGYEKGEPCILIKLNKIYDWVPEALDKVKDVEMIKKMPLEVQKFVENATDPNNIWISCEGENPSDKENIGPVVYHPKPGIPGYFFPFKKQTGYQTPFIFVQFKSPHPGVLINIECKAWAKNIVPDRAMRLGSVHFELMVD